MSAPPVRIESKAWTDSRYASLALRLGLPRAEFALVLVATIWRWQTEHYTAEKPTYSVPRSVVEGALGSLQGPEALVAADLAELEPDGRLRIKGGLDDAGMSRISWLWDDREQRRTAGKASAARRKAAGDPRVSRGRFGDLPPTDDQRTTNEPPTATERSTERRPSSPDSGLRTPDPEVSLTAGAREPADQTPPTATLSTIAPIGADTHQALADELHARHSREVARLKSVIPGCAGVSIGGGMLVGDARVDVLYAVGRWAADARELGVETAEIVATRMDHLVKVREATARKVGHLRFWVPSTFWPWAGLEKDLGQSPEQARADRPRDGSRFANDRQPAPMPAVGKGPAPVVVSPADRAAAAEELKKSRAALGLVEALGKQLGGQR